MKNEVVQREDSFPKTPPEDFHVVSKFKTNMGVITKIRLNKMMVMPSQQ